MMKKSLRFMLLMWFVCGFGGSFLIEAQSQPEAGFLTLEANNYYFHKNSYFNRIALRTSPARIWYVYQPADSSPESKPLFVFFNGGPGGATSSGLMSANTGRFSVSFDNAAGEGVLVPNPSSWTRLGNLLHIDMRTAGFSYSLMDNPQDDELRKAEFAGQNYNSFSDGADFIRVILRFLAAHPQIRANRVIIVGESYGGIRSIVLFHLLLYYRNYIDGHAVFQDPGLVEEIQQHYDSVFPEFSGQTVPPDVIARQFSHQVLIQPALSREFQRQSAVEMLESPGSLLHQLGEDTGFPYVPYRDSPGAVPNPTTSRIKSYIYDYLDKINRDPYFVSKPANYFLGFLAGAADLLRHYGSLSLMTGVDTAAIPELYASARAQAYKTRLQDGYDNQAASILLGPLPKERPGGDLFLTEGGDLTQVFGELQPWDRYFIDLSNDVADAFYVTRMLFLGYEVYYPSTPLYGRMFLENVAWVNTFVTNAAYDVVVWSPSIPPALGMHNEIVANSIHDTQGPSGSSRPGQIILNYRSSAVPGFSAGTRTIRFPYYADSGHAVTLTQPEEILLDVTSWLQSTGMVVGSRGGGDR